MSRPKKKRRTRVHHQGLPPGTIKVQAGAAAPVIDVFGYGPDRFEEVGVTDVDSLAKLRGRWPVLWVNVCGHGDAAIIEKLGQTFELHPLALEDVVNTFQRPKVEPYETALFIVLRMLRWTESVLDAQPEQMSFFVGDNYVLSIQEFPGDPFNGIRDRIRMGRKMLRSSGPDYLAYALLDAVVDSFFPLVQSYSELLEGLEEDALERPTRHTMGRIRSVRSALIRVRRTLWPLRDVTLALQNDGLPFIEDATRIYLRDVFDHALRLIDLAESFRDQVSGLTEAYMSSVSFRMNEVMGVLTIVGTIFMPLSFMTGLYGMNFDTESPWNMPELSVPFGYPALLLAMAIVVAAMVLYFRRRGWMSFGSLDDR